MRLRNSASIELLLILFVYAIGHWIWLKHTTINDIATCYATPINGQIKLTLAGYCYNWISLPIFQIILLRWYFHLFIWYRFLCQVSKLTLNLNALHPDQSGGLGFLAQSVLAFFPVLLAHTLLLAGSIANQIFYMGGKLPDYKLEIVGFLAFLMVLVILPLFFFILPLVKAKLIGMREYVILSSQYVNDFRRKWLDIKSDAKNNLLGSSDIQSLADLSNSFGVVREMRVLPISRGILVHLFIVIIIPLAPLLLTVINIEDIIKPVFKILF